jgi:hypothetical protein
MSKEKVMRNHLVLDLLLVEAVGGAELLAHPGSWQCQSFPLPSFTT